MEKPSYFTSTLSQLAVASVGIYLLGCVAVLWKHVPPDQAEALLKPLKWAAEVFGASYLVSRKNGGSNPPAPPPVSPT